MDSRIICHDSCEMVSYTPKLNCNIISLVGRVLAHLLYVLTSQHCVSLLCMLTGLLQSRFCTNHLILTPTTKDLCNCALPFSSAIVVSCVLPNENFTCIGSRETCGFFGPPKCSRTIHEWVNSPFVSDMHLEDESFDTSPLQLAFLLPQTPPFEAHPLIGCMVDCQQERLSPPLEVPLTQSHVPNLLAFSSFVCKKAPCTPF